MGMRKIAGFVAVAMITLVAKAGSGSGDVEHVIAKPPAIVRATLSAALIDEPTQTLTSPDGGTTSVRTRIDRHDDEIVQTIVIDGRPGFISTFSFEPEDGGSSTRVKVDYKIDRAHIDATSYARGNRETAPMVDPSAVARAHVRGDSYDD